MIVKRLRRDEDGGRVGSSFLRDFFSTMMNNMNSIIMIIAQAIAAIGSDAYEHEAEIPLDASKGEYGTSPPIFSTVIAGGNVSINHG